MNITSIEIVPNEILCKVFSYLSAKHLIINVKLVCKRWCYVICQRNLWTRLTSDDIKSLQVNSNSIGVILKRIYCDNFDEHTLNYLSLDGVEFAAEELAKQIDYEVSLLFPWIMHLENLRELSLSFCPLDHHLTGILVTAIAYYCPKLKSLILTSSNVYDNVFEMKFPAMTKLDVAFCNTLTDKFLCNISHCNLKHLNVDGVQWIGDEAMKHLLCECQHSLEYLWIDGENLTDDGLQYIECCYNMRVLKISFCEELTDITLSRISGLQRLNLLSLRKGSKFTKEGLIFMLKNFDGKIFYADLSECVEFNDEVVDCLTKVCPFLRTLDLSWCWNITDKGLNCIVKQCHHIQILKLIGIPGLIGEPLWAVAEMMPRLMYLDLSTCNCIKDNIIKKIAQKNQSLTIVDYYGNIVKYEKRQS